MVNNLPGVTFGHLAARYARHRHAPELHIHACVVGTYRGRGATGRLVGSYSIRKGFMRHFWGP